jgi:hypothetical protein
MGLDCSHDAWRGAYSAFNRWRDTIAKAAGYAVLNVKFDDGMTQETIMLDWGHITEANLYGDWEKTPSDPLIVLFVHSDCEGEIKPEQAVPLADALEKLIPALGGDGGGHIGNVRAKTEAFIAGLRLAAAANEPLEFD